LSEKLSKKAMKIVRKGASFVFLIAGNAGFNLTPITLPVAAQIIPDSTLPNPSIVLPGGQVSIVGGGTAVGTNLFHSFQEFSLAPGTGAIFNYAPAIQNVFSRVTGTGISRIEGFLGASGTANLFLLNPNGFIFGPQAAVNVGGSFLAATADSLHFPGGVEFSAANPQASLLSTTVPIGLSFSPNAGSISVRGQGYSIREFPPTSPFFIDPPSSGLSASGGQTLALLGGTVELEGGTAVSLGGHVELGAVRQGWVGLQTAVGGWQFDYSRVNAFGNIQIRDLALVGALGLGGGSVRLSGQDITVGGGGLVLIQNLGDAPSGDLQVEARGTLRIAGDVVNPNPGSPFAVGRSSLTTEGLGTGKGGDITIRAQNLILQEGGVIGARTFGPGAGGAINLSIAEDILLLEHSPLNPRFFSGISALTGGTGQGGEIEVSARNLTARNGGSLASVTFGAGASGGVTLNVRDTVLLTGVVPKLFLPSGIGSSSLGSGAGGRLALNTGTLIVRDGARVDTSAFASGQAGSISINASERVEVSGTVPGSINPSLIGSAVDAVDPGLQALFGLPARPSGTAGSIEMETPQLLVRQGGAISVRNQGTGGGGNITIRAADMALSAGGSITAATASGTGGNIALSAGSLSLNGGSQITATAGGSGNGGNIAIGADLVLLRNGSRIAADAFAGNGGNVAISAQAVFQDNFSAITASSNLGLAGTVRVDVERYDYNPEVVQVALDYAPAAVAATACLTGAGTELVVERAGGLPASPEKPVEAFSLPPSPVTDAGDFGVRLVKTQDGRLFVVGCQPGQ
jgi:filamentous hemagglutinin family protein